MQSWPASCPARDGACELSRCANPLRSEDAPRAPVGLRVAAGGVPQTVPGGRGGACDRSHPAQPPTPLLISDKRSQAVVVNDVAGRSATRPRRRPLRPARSGRPALVASKHSGCRSATNASAPIVPRESVEMDELQQRRRPSAPTDAGVLLLVLWGSARLCRFGHHPHVRIAHASTLVAHEDSLVDRDFRNG